MATHFKNGVFSATRSTYGAPASIGSATLTESVFYDFVTTAEVGISGDPWDLLDIGAPGSDLFQLAVNNGRTLLQVFPGITNSTGFQGAAAQLNFNAIANSPVDWGVTGKVYQADVSGGTGAFGVVGDNDLMLGTTGAAGAATLGYYFRIAEGGAIDFVVSDDGGTIVATSTGVTVDDNEMVELSILGKNYNVAAVNGAWDEGNVEAYINGKLVGGANPTTVAQTWSVAPCVGIAAVNASGGTTSLFSDYIGYWQTRR